jgi:hypothetical protein
VISAMGKTTNALELVIKNYFEKSNELHSSLQEVKKYHYQILMDLFEDEEHDVYFAVNSLFADLEYFIRSNKSPNYNFVYDQVVSYGELISTTIVSHYFAQAGLKNNWIDVRNFIKTDNTYRDANVDWEKTQQLISKGVKKKALNITQGFLGSDENNFTTTLGREGSDYTAAIFAYCLNAESVEPNFVSRSHRIGFLRRYGDSPENFAAVAKKGNTAARQIVYQSAFARNQCFQRQRFGAANTVLYCEKRSIVDFPVVYRFFLYHGRKHQRNFCLIPPVQNEGKFDSKLGHQFFGLCGRQIR